MLYYAAVINGLISPLVLFFILRIASNASIMRSYANGKLSNILGWTIFTIMSVAGALFLFLTFGR